MSSSNATLRAMEARRRQRSLRASSAASTASSSSETRPATSSSMSVVSSSDGATVARPYSSSSQRSLPIAATTASVSSSTNQNAVSQNKRMTQTNFSKGGINQKISDQKISQQTSENRSKIKAIDALSTQKLSNDEELKSISVSSNDKPADNGVHCKERAEKIESSTDANKITTSSVRDNRGDTAVSAYEASSFTNVHTAETPILLSSSPIDFAESEVASDSLRSIVRKVQHDFNIAMQGIHSEEATVGVPTRVSDDNDISVSDEEYDSSKMQREITAATSLYKDIEDTKIDDIVALSVIGNGQKKDKSYLSLPPRPHRTSNQADAHFNTTPLIHSRQHTGTGADNVSSTGIPSSPIRHSNAIKETLSTTPHALYETPVSASLELSGHLPQYTGSYDEYDQNDDEKKQQRDIQPKTPLTMMRSVINSISKDRIEIEGTRRPLFASEEEPNGRSRSRANSRDERNGMSGETLQQEETLVADNVEESVDTTDDFTNMEYLERRELKSSCIAYGSEVVIRFRTPTALTSLTIQPGATNNNGLKTSPLVSRVCFVANEAHGKFDGGNDRNIFVIIYDGISTSKNDGNNDPLASHLCYGDTIALRSNIMDRVLGVQKMEAKTNQSEVDSCMSSVKVGCFRRFGRFPQGDRWTILRGGSNAPYVQLGPVIESSSLKRIPVYSGDPIVLRNDLTGGMLSLGDTLDLTFGLDSPSFDIVGWSLNIITSSYQLNDGMASTEENHDIIEYMQHHNQCRPRKRETFQIFIANIPLCPDWVYLTCESMNRIFLDGSYLSNQSRYSLSPQIMASLFPDNNASKPHDRKYFPHLASLSVDVQESILLEEIIGAMIGLEGKFIRFHSGHSNPTSSEDASYLTNPGFLLTPLTSGIDLGLENIISRMLPLCSNYIFVNEYVSSSLCHYECGVIARALCEAIGKLLQEYLSFVSKLDYQLHEPATSGLSLSMTMVHVLAQPATRTMSILYEVVSAVRNKKGGCLLNALLKLKSSKYSGDGKGIKIISHLWDICAVPYTRMLKSWLKKGRLHDPYNEFMIEVTNRSFQSDSITIKQGMEFENWCRVSDVHVLKSVIGHDDPMTPIKSAFGADHYLSTLHMSTVDKVLTTGRYWRAIHFCNETSFPLLNDDQTTSSTEANMLLNPVKLSQYIDHSYHKASDLLLQMMLIKYDLLSSLEFMKRYFLLDQGDFFVEFLDTAEEELTRALVSVSQGRIQNAVANSIGRTSEFLYHQSSYTDLSSNINTPHSSQLASTLRCSFKKQSLVEELDDIHRHNSRGSSKRSTRQKELKGYEALQLTFKCIPFPTSLLLSHSQMRSYQFLFRQIFFAKYVERQLVKMWSDHQLLKQMKSLKTMKQTFCLRCRMIHFIQNFVYYMKFDVVEPNWRELEKRLKAAKEHCSNESKNGNLSTGHFPHTVDDMLHDHNLYLIRIITQCLLTNTDLIKTSTKIMTTCLLFTEQMKFFMNSTKIDEHHETTRIECMKLRRTNEINSKKKNDSNHKAEFRLKREERARRCSDRIVREVSTKTFQHMITRFDEVFSANLTDFMTLLKNDYGKRSNAHLTNLFMQLDYNGFVSSRRL